MNDYSRTILLVHAAYREDDWRRADEWRRLHARPDAPPLPAEELIDKAPRSWFAFIRRLMPRHA